MFTGLVQAMGRVESVEDLPERRRLVIDAEGWSHRPAAGDSVAISGCCLTAVTDSAGGRLVFDAIPETLRLTTIGDLAPGDAVNLEHSVTASTLMGGHVVQGHVDGLGEVVSVETRGEWRVRVAVPEPLMKYAVPKGSICVAGVSLTIAALDVADRWIEITLIPETLERTTLSALAIGERVNLEMDVMSKTIVHHLEHYLGHAPAGAGR